MKGYKAYLFTGVLLVIAYVVAEYNRPMPTNWSPTYRRADKIPFGTYLLYERLPDLFNGRAPQSTRLSLYDKLEQLAGAKSRGQAFVSVSEAFMPDKNDVKALFRFLRSGNQAFIAADQFNRLIEDTLRLRHSTAGKLLKAKRALRFTNAAFSGKNFVFDKGQMDGCFYRIKNRGVKVLGKNDLDSVNFIGIRIGAGMLYLHSNPSAFTNYSVIHPATRYYPAAALSYLPRNTQVVWDDYSAFGATGNRSPMRVILGNDYLRMAWYLAAATLLLFVLAEMKRRQRIIPVMVPPANRSLEFVNVIGQLYYEERNHTDLAQKKTTYFGEFVRMHYALSADDAGFEAALVRKSGAAAETVSRLMQVILPVKRGMPVSETELIDLNRNLEKFYEEVS